MPKIYDNKKTSFLSGLTDALERSYKSDICTAYFNLRGWKKIANFIDKYKGEEDHQCCLLLGMYNSDDEFKRELIQKGPSRIDRKQAKKLREQTVKNFRNQLMRGIPSNEDEKSLRKLASQLKSKKVIVKCFTRHPLHAKLYLTFNKSEFAKKVGFLGSSNLTYAGLEKNGELNIDVLDQESCETLSQWFEERWQDQYTRPLQRTEKHYEIVRSGLNTIVENLKHLSSQSGRLGTSRNPRRKLFEKLDSMNDTSIEIEQIMEDLYHYPLSNEAEHTLKRMFRRKISDKEILKFVCEKHRNETLVNKKESKRMDEEPRIVCSMGLVK